ncbi:hypothetical protein EBR77_02010 [bacterium]|nr:hypothetical protein [bacterium]
MNSLYSLYKNALFWNIQSALVYKLLLITHQTFLFYITPQELFGHAGTLFASLFFLISITNFGFDYSLISLFSRQYTDKKNISIVRFLIYKIISSCIVAGIIWYAYHTLHISYLSFLFQKLSPWVMYTYLSLYITENTKKTLALHADLSFQNKQHFFVEIGSLLGYICTVWGIYFYTQTIDLPILIVPFSVWSLIECILLFWFVSTTISQTKTGHAVSILSDQPLNYINQMFKTLYSTNSLFMIVSWQYGFAKVGSIKLLLDGISFLHTFLYKTIGTPLAALYARDQHIPHLQRTLQSYSITLGITWTCIIIAMSLYHYLYSSIPEIITLVCIISISFLEYAQIPYEKILLVQQKAWIIFMYYSVGIIQGGIICVVATYLHIHIPFIFFIFMSKMYALLFIQKHAQKFANFEKKF